MIQIKADIIGEQIAVSCDYDSGVVTKLKNVGGGRWKPSDKTWRYKLSMDVCRALRRAFDSNLLVSNELAAWATEAIAREDKMRALTKADDAKLHAVPRISPGLAEAMSMRRYQRVGAQFIAEGRNVIIADEPGLGKTLESIGGLMEANCWRGPILVIAPLTSLRSVWEYELLKWTNAIVTVAVPPRWDSAEARMERIGKWIEGCIETPRLPHVLVVNPEMVRAAELKFPELHLMEWTAIIIDESHRYLAGIRSAKKKTQTGEALLKLKVREKGVKIALSGTPMRGKPTNLWGTLHWLQPKRYTSFYNWAGLYFEKKTSKYSAHVIGDLRPDRAQALYDSLDELMLRRTKGEVVKELPPKQHIDVYCDMTDSQAIQYKQMSTTAIAELGDFNLSAVGILAIMTRLKQFAICGWGIDDNGKVRSLMSPKLSCKTAAIEQMLIERGIAGEERTGENKIVFASQFTDVINSLGDFLDDIKVEHMEITGAVKEHERVEVTQNFQTAGGPRVLLMNTKAGGVSITLDAFCDELVVIDETWNPDDQTQLEDRIHRVSRIHQVMIYQLITRDTIDEYIKKVAGDKREILKLLLDERRGVEFAKTMAAAR